MSLNKKEEQLILDCYRELYKKAIPSANFDELVEKATINKRGEKEIQFNNYEIDDTLLHEIIDKHAEKIKIKWRSLRIKNTILLGCSPKSVNLE